MIGLQRIQVAGQPFVLLPEREYDRLCSRAAETVPLADDDLPPLPKPDKHGNFPALEYARISLARGRKPFRESNRADTRHRSN